MMVEPVPGLGLTPTEWADDWTNILVWNWCPANGHSTKLVIIGQDWCADVAMSRSHKLITLASNTTHKIV